MTKIFDDKLLKKFAESFYGYGNYSGKYWCIGMEEGGGNSFEEISKRFATWQKRGECELEDLADYHIEIGMKHFFNERPRLQATWNRLIRIILSAEEKKVTTEEVRYYQRDELGRRKGMTCLLELLPLPSPNAGAWLYAQHSQLDFLKNKSDYMKYCLPIRKFHLQALIKLYKPKVVVFYGVSFLEHWSKISGVKLQEINNNEWGTIHLGHKSSIFVVTKHPAAVGITHRYFHEVGKFIKKCLS